jgi:hypothetical protein
MFQWLGRMLCRTKVTREISVHLDVSIRLSPLTVLVRREIDGERSQDPQAEIRPGQGSDGAGPMADPVAGADAISPAFFKAQQIPEVPFGREEGA